MIHAIVFDAFLQPFRFAFTELLSNSTQVAILLVDKVIWTMYVLDVVLHFFCQVPDSNGVGMQTPLCKIARLYLRGGFCAHALSLLPWDQLCGQIPQGIPAVVARSLRLTRLVRLVDLGQILYRWVDTIYVSHVFGIIFQNAFSTCLTLHIVACVWGFVGQLSSHSRAASWIKVYLGNTAAGECNAQQLYLQCLYWAIVTTTGVGFGDIVPAPQNILEHVVVIIVIMVTASRWSIVVANIVGLVQDSRKRNDEYQKTMDTVQRIAKLQGLPRDQVLSVREYFTKFYELEKEKGTRQLVQRLSPMLQRDVVATAYSDWIEDVPWISHMTRPCLVQLILVMENFLFVPRESLPETRMTAFVQRGLVMYGGKFLRKGDCWGIDMIVKGGMRKRACGIAMSFVSTLGLSYHHLERVLDQFPEDAWNVKKHAVFLALRRRIVKLAETARKRASVTGKSVSMSDCMGETGMNVDAGARYVNLPKALQHIVGTMRDEFATLHETHHRIQDRQAALDKIQLETVGIMRALQFRLKDRIPSK